MPAQHRSSTACKKSNISHVKTHTSHFLRYRKPRNSYKSLRTELGARHNAFSRGSAYLERYCLLIALAGYFEECGIFSATTFRQWLANRWGS